ncbi:hypothetical protein EDB85DRAFT_146295 [Lactarius pseudohatsudake]|nr:hypothetical protein EDB85DRAFT_146295 [Lactarius pseudohatsudake]
MILVSISTNCRSYQEILIPTLSCKVLCDILITIGMVYYLLSRRTQFRRVFAISCVTMLAKYRNTLIYIPSLFIMIRLSLCAFILNSRDTLRETLDRREDVAMDTSRGRIVPCGTQDTTETSTKTAASKGLPLLDFSDPSFSDSVIAFDRDKYPGSSINGMSGY